MLFLRYSESVTSKGLSRYNLWIRNSCAPRSAKRSIDMPFGAFDGIPGIIDPSRELMITDLNVVEDKSRTFDVCKPDVGTKMGAWTFGRLLTDISNRMIEPAELVQRWLELWLNDQTVNSFKVPARASGMQNLLLITGLASTTGA